MKRKAKTLLLLFLAFSGSWGFSQNERYDTYASNFVLDYGAYSGKIVKIFPKFPDREYAFMNELNFTLQTRGKKQWHQLYHFPQLGISMIYGYLGNNDVFGHSYALVPNLSFNSKKFKTWGAQINVGMGFSYFDNPYDYITNPDNTLIGSSITNMTFLKMHVWKYISPSLALKGGAGVFHCSNGHYTLPNLGINLPTISLGLKYSPSAKKEFHRFDSITTPERKLHFTASLGIGRHEFGSSTKPTGGPKYFIYQSAFYVTKRYRYVNNVHAGLFVNYYSGFYDYTVNHEVFDKNQHLKAMVVTAFLGHEFMIDRLGLVAQMGVNVYNPFFKEFKKIEKFPEGFELFSKTYIINKLGIQYYFRDPMLSTHRKLFVGIYLKANFGQADFAELATGYTF